MLRPGASVRSIQSALRTGGSRGRHSATSNTASTEHGFITTKYERWPCWVSESVMYHVREAAGAHGSTPSPRDGRAARTSQPAAIQPPNASMYVASAVDPASTGWRTSCPGGTLIVIGADGAPSLSSVSRTSTGCGPGSASAIVPLHPSPPPCGHNQTLETAVPRTAAAGVAGPTRCAAIPPTTTRPITTSTRTPRPYLLPASTRSSSDRLPGDPQRGGPHGGQHPDGDRAR